MDKRWKFFFDNGLLRPLSSGGSGRPPRLTICELGHNMRREEWDVVASAPEPPTASTEAPTERKTAVGEAVVLVAVEPETPILPHADEATLVRVFAPRNPREEAILAKHREFSARKTQIDALRARRRAEATEVATREGALREAQRTLESTDCELALAEGKFSELAAALASLPPPDPT